MYFPIINATSRHKPELNIQAQIGIGMFTIFQLDYFNDIFIAVTKFMDFFFLLKEFLLVYFISCMNIFDGHFNI